MSSTLMAGLAPRDSDGALDGEVVELHEAASFFARELGHPDDRDATATIASAVLPLVRAADPDVPAEAVAAAVDVGAQAAKATAKAATGAIPVETAASHVLDRTAAAIGTLIGAAAPHIAETGGAWVGAALGALVGLAPVGAQVGRVLGRVAGHAIAAALGSGVATMVKELGRAVSRIATEAVDMAVGAARRFAAALGL
jgi:hypothetical protein